MQTAPARIFRAIMWATFKFRVQTLEERPYFPAAYLESSYAGSAMNVQLVVKDSEKYAASGGWGYADFTNGRPGNEALHEKCFPCHLPAKDRDYVFTGYAPTP
jgi:hypothetical protein